jgi:DNA-binding transcriptional LysR family regulator
LIAPWGGTQGVVDKKLAEKKLTRQVAATVPYFLLAPEAIAKTDLVSTVPRGLAEEWRKVHPIALIEPPLDLEKIEVYLLWHQRTHRSAAHQWVRGKLLDHLR